MVAANRCDHGAIDPTNSHIADRGQTRPGPIHPTPRRASGTTPTIKMPQVRKFGIPESHDPPISPARRGCLGSSYACASAGVGVGRRGFCAGRDGNNRRHRYAQQSADPPNPGVFIFNVCAGRARDPRPRAIQNPNQRRRTGAARSVPTNRFKSPARHFFWLSIYREQIVRVGPRARAAAWGGWGSARLLRRAGW